MSSSSQPHTTQTPIPPPHLVPLGPPRGDDKPVSSTNRTDARSRGGVTLSTLPSRVNIHYHPRYTAYLASVPRPGSQKLDLDGRKQWLEDDWAVAEFEDPTRAGCGNSIKLSGPYTRTQWVSHRCVCPMVMGMWMMKEGFITSDDDRRRVLSYLNYTVDYV